MEKFYIVTNEKFLNEIKEYKCNVKKQKCFIKDFFRRNEISGNVYYISGDGPVNCPFEEYNKDNIWLYIDDCEENNRKFGKQLLKRVFFGELYLRRFRKGCTLLKTFQNECVEKHIVINNHLHIEGDYFEELYLGGYSVARFEFDGKYYLNVKTEKHHSITPKYCGFEEIKGSDFYKAFEKLKENDNK